MKNKIITILLDHGAAIQITPGKMRGNGSLRSYDLKDNQASPEFNAAIDAIESLILSLYCSGMDVSTPEFKDGVQQTVDEIGDRFGD